jgi:predicted RNase H-like nuclease
MMGASGFRAGYRACDRLARERLGDRRVCVFPAPDRELFGRSFEQAREMVLARRTAGVPGNHPIMTRQSIGILPKIAEVDAVLRQNVNRQDWVIEVHPELCFVGIAREQRKPIPPGGLPKKRKTVGRSARLGLLEPMFTDLAQRFDSKRWSRSEVGADDILDAYAALWTARRWRRQDDIEVLGGDVDAHGLIRRMVI